MLPGEPAATRGQATPCRQGAAASQPANPSVLTRSQELGPLGPASASAVDTAWTSAQAMPPSPSRVSSPASVATPAPNVPRGISAASGPPSESSTVRHGQFNTAAVDDVTDDSDPDVSTWQDRTQHQSLQEILAFLDQKEREVSTIFTKTRKELLQAVATSGNGAAESNSGKWAAVTTRSDEVTVGWREFGEPFYRAISWQRECEKENQTLREKVALKRNELERLQLKLEQMGLRRVGHASAKGGASATPQTLLDIETSPLSGAVVEGPALARQQPLLPPATLSTVLPNTPNFPAAPSPTSPLPFDLGVDRGASAASLLDSAVVSTSPKAVLGSRGAAAERRLVDDALMVRYASELSSSSARVEPGTISVPRAESSLVRSDSLSSSSVSTSQIYRNVEGQGGAQRR